MKKFVRAQDLELQCQNFVFVLCSYGFQDSNMYLTCCFESPMGYNQYTNSFILNYSVHILVTYIVPRSVLSIGKIEIRYLLLKERILMNTIKLIILVIQ